MDDILSYSIIGIIMFGIGVVGGYIITGKYYSGRFVKVAKECEDAKTIVPLIAELEKRVMTPRTGEDLNGTIPARQGEGA